jgi:hypothetical protein
MVGFDKVEGHHAADGQLARVRDLRSPVVHVERVGARLEHRIACGFAGSMRELVLGQTFVANSGSDDAGRWTY